MTTVYLADGKVSKTHAFLLKDEKDLTYFLDLFCQK